MNPSHTLTRLALLSTLGALTLAACTFPNDGTRDDVGQFDATSDMEDVTEQDEGPAIDVATDVFDARSDARTDADTGLSDVVLCPPDSGPSFQVCRGACVDTARSPVHCGRCDNNCGLGTDCVAGTCNLRCSAGTVRCGASCIDPLSNPEFCGADATCSMFTRCMPGQSCVNGACRANCPPGNIFCMDRCVDPSNNPQFCGARDNCTGANAGTMCSSAQVCAGGTCQSACPSGTIDCGGSCVDPLSNRMFCGASGNCMGSNAGRACGAGEVCVNRVCTAGGCATGTVRCGDSCIDPLTNRSFCGARGDCNGMNAGARCAATEQCLNGSCVYAPPPASYLATAVDANTIRVPVPVNVRLSAPQTATFYYTIDGSVPSPGSMNTRTAMGRSVELTNLGRSGTGTPECTLVRWYADYGAPLGREPITHERSICWEPAYADVNRADNLREDPFNLAAMDNLQLESEGVTHGAVAVVDRGATVSLRFRLRQYPPTGGGFRLAQIYLEGPTRQLLFCHWIDNVREENFAPPRPPTLEFRAPMAPGRYPIRWTQLVGEGCALPSPIDLRTIAVLIVR